MSRTSLRVAALTAALALVPAAAAEAAKPIPLGAAHAADVAVDPSGAAHVALLDPEWAVRYCHIPRGAGACDRQTAVAMPGIPMGGTVHVQADGARVLVTVSRDTDDEGDGPAVAVSTDGGATFAPGVRLAAAWGLDGQQVVGPDGALWHGVLSSETLNAVRASLDGSTPVTSERVVFDDDATGGLGVGAIAFDGDLAIVARGGTAPGYFTHRLGSGDANDRASWAGPSAIVPLPGHALSRPSLAGGSKGTVLTALETGDLSATITARRWTGSGFGAPATLYKHSGGSDNANGGEVAADPSGRLHAVFSGDNEESLRYTRSNDGGATWSPAQVLTTSAGSGVLDGHVSAASDGQGFATAMRDGQAFAVPLEPSAGLPGEPTVTTKSTYEGTDILLGLPKGCLPSTGDVAVTLTQKARNLKRGGDRRTRIQVKVRYARFAIDGRWVKTDRKAPFTQTLRLSRLVPGSTHEVRAQAFVKVKYGLERWRTIDRKRGKPASRSIRQKVRICS